MITVESCGIAAVTHRGSVVVSYGMEGGTSIDIG